MWYYFGNLGFYFQGLVSWSDKPVILIQEAGQYQEIIHKIFTGHSSVRWTCVWIIMVSTWFNDLDFLKQTSKKIQKGYHLVLECSEHFEHKVPSLAKQVYGSYCLTEDQLSYKAFLLIWLISTVYTAISCHLKRKKPFYEFCYSSIVVSKKLYYPWPLAILTSSVGYFL